MNSMNNKMIVDATISRGGGGGGGAMLSRQITREVKDSGRSGMYQS